MSIVVEYVVVFSESGPFCSSLKDFLRLLQVHSEVVISGKEVSFQGKKTCILHLSTGEIENKGQRYFQLRFQRAQVRPTQMPKLGGYMSLLKAIRWVIVRSGGKIETLRDDVSSFYALKSYPLIHSVENLMRRLIANFMLINVGQEWIPEALPRGVEDALQKNRSRSSGQTSTTDSKHHANALYSLDFVHLGQILFDPYSKTTADDLYKKISSAKTTKQAKALRAYIPQSNWSRYFASHISCEDGYLKTRWESLYILRCKVAHNGLMTEQDHTDIVRLVGEVKPRLEEGIEKLAKVKVPPRERERVAESAARVFSSLIGEFIQSWQELESAITDWLEAHKKKVAIRIPSAFELQGHGVFSRPQSELYDRLRLMRNAIVHGVAPRPSAEAVRRATKDVRGLIGQVGESNALSRLRSLSGSDLESEIDNLIADSIHEIVDVDPFASEMANTNASGFGIDEYSVEDIDLSDTDCRVTISYTSTGDQDEDRPYAGNIIDGKAEAVIDSAGNVTFENVTANLRRWDR